MSLASIYGHETQQLEKALAEMWRREEDYREACLALADAEHAFKIKQAKEFKIADGSVDLRKAEALIQCEDEHESYTKAEAIKDFTKEKLKDVQSSVTARQSILKASVTGDFNYATNRQVT